MDFELSSTHKDFQLMVREFAETELKPHAARIDETGEFPWDQVNRMRDLG